MNQIVFIREQSIRGDECRIAEFADRLLCLRGNALVIFTCGRRLFMQFRRKNGQIRIAEVPAETVYDSQKFFPVGSRLFRIAAVRFALMPDDRLDFCAPDEFQSAFIVFISGKP